MKRILSSILVSMIFLMPTNSFAAKVTVELPDDMAASMVDSFTKAYKYQDKIKDQTGNLIDNPVSKSQFTENVLVSFSKEVIKSVKSQEASEEARKKALEDTEAAFDISKIKLT